MNIISHRGYWKSAEEKNQEVAFTRSFDLGFGTETDIRDLAGELVISHDMPDGTEMTLDAFLALPGATELPLALNVKADGLACALDAAMRSHNARNWFVFDMSVPDMRGYLRAGVPVYTRMSEVERAPAWLDAAAGVWLDAFSDTWFDASHIDALLQSGKKVCVVSSELHGRDHEQLWNLLFPLRDSWDLTLCTDIPERARAFFEGQ